MTAALMAVVALVGLGLALFVARSARAQADADDERALAEVVAALEGAVGQAQAAMAGASATLADGSSVDGDLFGAYAAEVVASSAIEALANVEVVSASERAAWERRRGRPMLDLAPDGFVTATTRPVHLVVADVQPSTEAARSIIGFDIASEPRRADTARRAAALGTAAISAPIESQPSGTSAVFMARPLYRDRTVPLDPDDRAGRLVGFVATSLSGTAILEDVRRSVPDGVLVSVEDEGVALLTTAQAPDGGRATSVSVADRSWRVRVDDPRPGDYGAILPIAVASLALVAVIGLLDRQRRRRRDERERIAALEHQIVVELQSSSLRRPPVVDGMQIAVLYEPATEGVGIGGDWYDVFEGRDGQLFVIVGDVAGHGVDAVAGMIHVSGALRSSLTAGASVDEATAMAEGAIAGVPGHELASVVVVQLDPVDGSFAYCNAGHLPALVVDADGGVRRLEESHRPILGVGVDVPLRRSSGTLPAGSSLVLYTDGLVERPDVDIDTAISALEQRLCAAVVDDADAHRLCRRVADEQRRSVQPRDDRVIIVVRRSPGGVDAASLLDSATEVV